MGYLPSDKSIYVAYKGSDSINNWITDFDATQTSYDIWPACGCNVHAGFYKAVNSIWSGLEKEINRLKGLYPTYSIKVTGHSLGAALAQMTGMRLI